MLFASVTLSNYLLVLLLSFGRDKSIPNTFQKGDVFLPPGNALIFAVEKAIGNTAVMCGWIVAFSAFFSFILTEQKYNTALLFLEVTNGTVHFSTTQNWRCCAFCMGFGGVCLFCQLFPDLKSLNVYFKHLLMCKLFTAGASYCISGFLFKFLPATISVFSQQTTEIKTNVFSTAGTCALYFMCLVFMISICSDNIDTHNLKYNSCHDRFYMIK